MTKNETSLLLYLETCAVDRGGLVDGRRMNVDDFSIACGWNETGYVRVARIPAAQIKQIGENYLATYECDLSETAWKDAAALRRERAMRSRSKRLTAKDAPAQEPV